MSWYQNPLVARFRRPFAYLLIIGILAFVPWGRNVTEQCQVLAGQRAFVRSQVAGVIQSVLVREGDVVQEGQVIARLDDRMVRAALARAEAELVERQAGLQKLEAGVRPERIRQAQVALRAAVQDRDFAQREVARLERLSGSVTDARRQRAKREWALKATAVDKARADLALLRAGYREEEIRIAASKVHRARVELALLQEDLNKHEIISPSGGRIATAKFEERIGERMEVGDLICEVADSKRATVEIFVPEEEIDLIEEGQPTTIKVRSLPLRAFSGEVTFVAPAAEEMNGQWIIRVMTEVDNPGGLLHPKMTGYAEIYTGRSTLLALVLRRAVRWVRVRFLI